MSDLQKTTPAQETAATEAATPQKKKTFWEKFFNFLMMGGFILVLILGVVIAVGISIVFQCK